MKIEGEYHPRSHLFKSIIDKEQIKTLRDALKAQTSQENSLCQLACKDGSLATPQFPLWANVTIVLGLALSGGRALLPLSQPARATQQGKQRSDSTGPRVQEEACLSILDVRWVFAVTATTCPFFSVPPGSRLWCHCVLKALQHTVWFGLI